MMKGYTILLLANLLFFSCTKKATNKEFAIIKGSISSDLKDSISVYSGLSRSNFVKSLSISNGIYNDTIALKSGSKYYLNSKNTSLALYLFPGAVVELDIMGKDLRADITFKGIDASASKYYLTKAPINKAFYDFMKGLLKRKAYDAKTKYDTLYAHMEVWQNNLHNNLKTYAGLSKDFVAFEEKQINYKVLYNASALTSVLDTLALPPFYEKALQNIRDLPVIADDYKNSDNYKSILRFKYFQEAKRLHEKDTTKNKLEVQMEVFNKIPNQYVKEHLIALNLENSIRRAENKQRSTTIYDTYIPLIKDKELAKGIKTVYRNKIALAKGQPSPKFINYENYKGSKTSLDDFKGKYVYIDIWATWCKPCLREIPALKKIEKSYLDKNIEFVSISVDNKKDYDKWTAFVKEENLGGTQLYATNSFKSSFIKRYNVQGIPRFILIDPKGNIVDKDAPRPSNKALITVLNSLENI